jgi:anti-anti-sigma regulatory factor
MPFQFKQKGKNGELTMDGSLTIEQAGEFRTLLLESLENVSNLTLKAVDVDQVDVACFQVLCSAHRLFDAKGKTLCLSKKTGDAFRQVVKTAGFTRVKACGLDLKTDCLWEEG